MTQYDIEPSLPVRDPELESLATGVELTIVSVLQGIPVAILVPRIGELFGSGELARFPYVPSSLLIIFMVWIAFVMHALSCITWPFDPLHNLLYFLVATSEALLLYFLEQPVFWFLALIAFALTMALSYAYNQRLLERQRILYTTPAAQALYRHVSDDQRTSLMFMGAYCVMGIIGSLMLQILLWIGLPLELDWILIGLGSLILPVVHVRWQMRMVAERARLIENARRS